MHFRQLRELKPVEIAVIAQTLFSKYEVHVMKALRLHCYCEVCREGDESVQIARAIEVQCGHWW